MNLKLQDASTELGMRSKRFYNTSDTKLVIVPKSALSLKHNSKINHSKKFIFGILNLNRMKVLLEFFYADRSNDLCTGMRKIIRLHYSLWGNFLLIHSNMFKL